MTRHVHLLLLVIALLVGTRATAAPKDVSPVLAGVLEKHKLPGMVAIVIEGEQVISTGAAGVRRLGSPDPVQLNDKFHIGSCTKAMTATLCAMLVQEGKLSWNTTLAQAFPDLKSKMHPAYQSVTLEQLLTNRGGAPADLNADGLWGRLWAFKGTPAAARRALLEGVVTRPPAYTPGEKYLYSNAGFAIAGHMAEVATKTPWETLLRDRLFKPLKMTSADFGAPGARAKLDQPRGHTEAGKPVEPGPGSDNPVAIGPAGIVHCTAADWAKFVSLHLGNAKGAQLLTPESLEKLHTPANGPGEKYAMGWIVADRPWADGLALTHAGSNTMWYAVTWLAPKRNFAVLVMCNQGGKAAAQATDEVCAALIQDYLKSKR